MLQAKKIPYKGKKVMALKGYAPQEWRPFLQEHGLKWEPQRVCWIYPGQPLPKPVTALINAQKSLEADAIQRVLESERPEPYDPNVDRQNRDGMKKVLQSNVAQRKPKGAFHHSALKQSPLRRQYLDLKAQYPDCLLMIELGDFYELFDEDAEIAAREADLVLTHRTYSKGQDKVPMCGFPVYAAESYLKKLVERGYHVAIAKKTGGPKDGGIVPRAVQQVITDMAQLEESKPIPPPPHERPDLKTRMKVSDRLRKFADKALAEALEREIPGELNTARRRRQYESNVQKAARLRVMAHKYTRLADLWESGELWLEEGEPPLEYIQTKKVAEIIQNRRSWDGVVEAELNDDEMTAERYAEIRAAWEALGNPGPYEVPGMIRYREMELADSNIDQYFPTPRSVAENMVRAANIREGARVLEPSAGAGHIADVIRELHPDATLEAYEVNADLYDILRDKGYTAARKDFLEVEPGSIPPFDAIVMNPPFSRVKGIGYRDVAHIQHAYEFLAPSGTLVALCSHSSAHFGTATDERKDFGLWLKRVDARLDDLVDGAFKDSDNPTPTKITRIVITKPEAEL